MVSQKPIPRASSVTVSLAVTMVCLLAALVSVTLITSCLSTPFEIRKSNNPSRSLPAVKATTFNLPTSSCAPPGKNFPVVKTAYKLQTISDDGSKFMSARVTDDYQSQFFYSNCFGSSNGPLLSYSNVPPASAIFKTPSGKATTPHSVDTRVELKANRHWYVGNLFTYTQSGTLYVLETPGTNALIFAQIHGDKVGGSEMVMLRWDYGAVRALTRFHYADDILHTMFFPRVSVGEKIEYSIKVVGTKSELKITVKMAVNGKTVSQSYTMPASGWCGIGLYFKAGSYNQDPNDDGTQCVIAFSAFNLVYDDYGERRGSKPLDCNP